MLQWLAQQPRQLLHLALRSLWRQRFQEMSTMMPPKLWLSKHFTLPFDPPAGSCYYVRAREHLNLKFPHLQCVEAESHVA